MVSGTLDELLQVCRKWLWWLTLKSAHVDDIWHRGSWEFKDKVVPHQPNISIQEKGRVIFIRTKVLSDYWFVMGLCEG